MFYVVDNKIIKHPRCAAYQHVHREQHSSRRYTHRDNNAFTHQQYATFFYGTFLYVYIHYL